MNITILNTPVTNLKQLEIIVPKIIDKYTFKAPDTMIVDGSAGLTPSEIATIVNFQFDPCIAYSNYDPIVVNQRIREFDAMNLMLTPLVGSPPPDIGTYDFCAKNGGLDAAGNIKPLIQWRNEPPVWTTFRAAPCYTP